MTSIGRQDLYTLLTTDAQLDELGINEDSVFGTSAVNTPAMRPFLVMRWEARPMAFKDTGQRSLTVWAHDEGSDYVRIDSILARVKEILTAVVHYGNLTQIAWTGDSDDLRDDGYETITRNAGFTVGIRPTT